MHTAPVHASQEPVPHTHALGAVDVVEKEDEYVILADTPGMTSKDVKVEMHGGMLSISGQRSAAHRSESKDHKTVRLERSARSFSRSFKIPANADPAQAW